MDDSFLLLAFLQLSFFVSELIVLQVKVKVEEIMLTEKGMQTLALRMSVG